MAVNAVDAVWIAAAVLTTKTTKRERKRIEQSNICFDATTIIQLAQKLTNEKVTEDTVLKFATAHVEGSICNYLVDVDGLRRVSYMGEFSGEKECPITSVINEGGKIKDINKIFKISDIYKFMNREYTEELKKDLGKRGVCTVNREWIISGNPQKYDCINALKDLRKIDWKQSTNVKVGDFLYLYLSEGFQTIKFKCRVNKIDLNKVEIDDKKYDISGKHDGTYGRYMEIEVLDELEGEVFSRRLLQRHGFISPLKPIRVNPEVKKYLDIVQNLQNCKDMDPDKHDGSYEMIRETVNSYANMENLETIDYKDLNLIYLMSVGTWKQKIPSKKKSINESHLPEKEKQRLVSILDKIWEKAENKEYGNSDKVKTSIGMFGTGFYTFKGKTDDISPRNFIQMCIDIKDLKDEDQILNRCEKTLNGSFKGMKASSASMVLHCLKPTVFPILNSNMGNDSIFVYLGVDMKKKAEIYTYIENVRRVKEFRDSNFTVKNYRIFDIATWGLSDMKNFGLHEFIDRLLNEYTEEKNKSFPNNNLENYVRNTVPKILKETGCFIPDDYEIIGSIGEGEIIPWIALFNKGITVSAQKGVYIIYLMHKDGEKMYLTFNQGFDELKKTMKRQECSECLKNVANNLSKQIDSRGFSIGADIDLGDSKDEKIEFYKNGTIFYKEYLKGAVPNDDELVEDLENMCSIYEDYISLQLGEKSKKKENDEIDKNMILYGPPGTGKTYNTAIYTVAICENIPLSKVKDMDYNKVLEIYRKLKEEKRVSFITFHQSYGYEEFIEGIKPQINDDTKEVGYTIKDGVFKAFCDRACQKSIKLDTTSVRDGARIWNVILGGTTSPELKKKCFDEGTIRIGWSDYPEVIGEDNIELNDKEKRILLNFQDEMEIGDIVVTRATNTSIDGIGIVTGNCEYDNTIDEYPRRRMVDWILKDINIDILQLNNGIHLDRKSVYALDRISVSDLITIVSKNVPDVNIQEETKPYVFIIDEINRGNISKIFGELITLIESTKRKGAIEGMETILPYSNRLFGVPNNVYIIGTMNTADRSIALMDTALRRRFQFIEMMPDVGVLRKKGADKINEVGIVLDVAAMLEKINERIEYLFDREHTIGHSFFIPLKDDPTVGKLSSIFKKEIIPLLQEYFYEDYSKIMMVLGDNGKEDDSKKFIIQNQTKANSIFKGDTSDIDIPDYSYSIHEDAFGNIMSYIEIYE